MKEVFLDGASNTPIDKRVLKAMRPYLNSKFVGNSFSIHDFGTRAFLAIEDARSQVVNALKVSREEVYFTSGATEGNNWVIHSIAEQFQTPWADRPRVICGATEHSSVLNACKYLEQKGFDVVYIKPNNEGRITAAAVKKHLIKKTCLVCVMAVNNEIGIENEVNKICLEAKELEVPVLVDCTQALSVGGESTELGLRYPYADYFTFSAHKIYGPTGVGCLIVRKGAKINPMLFGGAQENGKRGGTSNTAGIIGLGKAIEILNKEDYLEHFDDLFCYFSSKLCCSRAGVLNTVPDHPNIFSVNFSHSLNVENLAASLAVEGIAVSAGSACDAEHDDIEGFNPSHVLSALGLTEKEIRNTIRISFTKYTKKKDIDRLFEAIEILREEGKDYGK